MMDLERARRYALWWVARMHLHSERLHKKLLERGADRQVADELIAQFQQQGWLDDQRWLHRWLEEKQKKYAPRKVLALLQSQGYSAATLEAARSVLDTRDGTQNLREFFRKRYGRVDRSNRKEKERVIRALVRRGFSLDQVLEVWRENHD